jgi:G:T-mismatch repair DNA endonuclease (very short patch repair protein)
MENKNTKPELICQNLLKSMNISFKAHTSKGGSVPDLIIEDALK